MKETRSFRPSDFSLRDVPWIVVGYLVIAACSAGIGFLIEALPKL